MVFNRISTPGISSLLQHPQAIPIERMVKEFKNHPVLDHQMANVNNTFVHERGK